MSKRALSIKATVTTEIELSIDAAAKWFAGLDDDQQAQFFVAVAEESKRFPLPQGFQWYAVGGHLRNCTCSTDEARDMIRTIADGMEHSNHA